MRTGRILRRKLDYTVAARDVEGAKSEKKGRRRSYLDGAAGIPAHPLSRIEFNGTHTSEDSSSAGYHFHRSLSTKRDSGGA